MGGGDGGWWPAVKPPPIRYMLWLGTPASTCQSDSLGRRQWLASRDLRLCCVLRDADHVGGVAGGSPTNQEANHKQKKKVVGRRWQPLSLQIMETCFSPSHSSRQPSSWQDMLDDAST